MQILIACRLSSKSRSQTACLANLCLLNFPSQLIRDLSFCLTYWWIKWAKREKILIKLKNMNQILIQCGLFKLPPTNRYHNIWFSDDKVEEMRIVEVKIIFRFFFRSNGILLSCQITNWQELFLKLEEFSQIHSHFKTSWKIKQKIWISCFPSLEITYLSAHKSNSQIKLRSVWDCFQAIKYFWKTFYLKFNTINLNNNKNFYVPHRSKVHSRSRKLFFF